MLPWQNLPAPCNAFLWRLAATMLDISYRPLLNRYRRRLGIPPLVQVMPYLTRNLIVAADRELAPLPPEAPLDCRQTGYWHAAPADVLPPVVEAFLDAGPPPVYIGFGSMGDATPWKTIALLRRAVEMAGVRAIVQGGWARLDFKSDADCLCVNGDLPHDRLFARVAGAVHHGGAGTVMAAARAGIPQVIVPHILDQYYWGQRIRQLQIGSPPIPKNRLSTERLARALRQVLASPGIRANARALAVPLQGRDGAREAAEWITACARG
jgi:UDP:flavonoid glycosyltransferase YjiC (YdhE family)